MTNNFEQKPLWAKAPSGRVINIPILGVCGEFGSGKTLFGASIAPGNHPPNHPFAGKPRTGIIDAEMSSTTYEGSALAFERFDLPAMLMQNRASGFTPIELYEKCRSLIDSIPNDQYDVLIIDPVTDIDSGLTDYVKANCSKFGLSSRQLEKSSGLLWGVVKDQWNNWLLQIAQKCKTFVFTAHMRDHYIGNMPSGKREPKGKETLGKLASLYLELLRKPGKDGKVPAAPTARIIKGRLCDMILDADGEIQNVELLPPIFENCTPKTIRAFIATPPTEKAVVPEGHLDGDMKMAFQALIETQRNEANQAELQILELRKGLQPQVLPIPATKTEPVQPVKPIPLKPAVLPTTEALGTPVEPVTENQKSPVEPPFETKTDEPEPAKPTREEMTSAIKSAHVEKVFSQDEFKAVLDEFSVQQISKLSDEQNTPRLHFGGGVFGVLAAMLDIPRSKLDELARQAKDKSMFVSSLKTKETMRQLLVAQTQERDAKEVF